MTSLSAADPFEGAIWGSTYENFPPPTDDGKVTDVSAGVPVSPQLFVDAQPGETTWEVNASGSLTFPPSYTRIELYNASTNALVSTRITNHQTSTDGDTLGVCLQWLYSGLMNQCAWIVTDGAIAGTAGTKYYAKLSFATQQTLHYYQISDTIYQEYWLPTAWTTPVTTASGPAVHTPGIPGGMDGQCSCSHQTNRADPVNTATGTVTETVTDAAVPGKGVPLTLQRSYRSDASAATGLLGKGWSLGLESSLAPASDQATLIDADGAKVVFTKNSDGTFSAPKPVRYILSAVSGGFTVTALDHSTRTFDTAGRLTAVKDSDGSGLSLGYASGVLSSITDAAGRTASLTVDSATGRLTAVTLQDGRSVGYAYTGGQLTSVTGMDGGVTKYTYDGTGRLATIVDANGNTVTQNTYDATTGRIAKQIDAGGKEILFGWTPTEGAPGGSGESDMTAPNGGIWTDVYQAGVLMSSSDPLGHGPSRSYDPSLNIAEQVDANFESADMTYDAHGNVLTATAGGKTEKWQYDSADRLTNHTDGLGHTTTYTYDGDSARPLTESGAAGTTTYTYNSSDLVETETSPGGNVTTYGYDAAGNLTSTTTPEGNTSTTTYDDAGRVTSETDPRGNLPGADPSKFTTTYDYDAQGRLKTQTDPLGHTTSYTYDGNGNQLTVTDALGQVTTYGYDTFNRRTSVKGPDGKTSTTEYDAAGNVTATVDPLGNRTTSTYDTAKRLISTTSPRGNETGADKAKFTTTYAYDGVGNRTDVVDPAGGETVTEYDGLSRVTSVTDPLGHKTLTSYDDDGNIATTTDALGKVTTYTYDAADRQKTVTDPLGKVTSYGYDAEGHQTSQTTPLGFTTSWTFDDDGRMITQVDPRGNVAGADPSNFTTTFGYDAAGNKTTVTDALGKTTTTAYDANDDATSVKDPLGRETTTRYDDLGRIDKVTAPDGAATIYSYNVTGTLATREDPNGHTTTYGYDDAGRQTSVTDPLGRVRTVGYDADGNAATVTDARGITTTTAFDGRGLPSGTAYSDNTPAVGYSYFGDGKQKTITDGTGTRTFGYDADGRLASVTPSAGKGAFSYTYDDDGRITSRTEDYSDGAPLDWSGAVQTVSADLNGDGTTDVVRTDSKDGIRTYLGHPDGTFTPGSTLTGTGTGFTQVVPIELTSDGKTDLLTIDKSTGHMLRYNGDGSGGFAAAANVGAGWSAMTLTPGDFTGDGKQDFLAFNSSENQMYLYPGKGDGTFGTRSVFGSGWATYRPISLDFNGDGKIDLLAINDADGKLYFYPGKGDGTVATRVQVGTGWTTFHIAPGDFNGDGKLDLLGRDTVGNKLYVYPGTGSGTVSARITEADSWTGYGDPVMGRFDNNATLDIAATDTTGHLRVWTNDGAAHLTGAVPAATPASGQKTTYGYDDDSRQTSQTGPTGTVAYAYDPAENLTTTTLPAANGYTEKRGYDADGRLTSIGSTKDSSTLADWQLSLDAVGQPTRIDATRTGKATAYQYYTYDNAGRLLTDCTSAAKTTACPATDLAAGTTYTYDGVGNRTTATTNGALTTYSYDAADELTESLTGTTTTSYSYDKNGNQTGDGTNTFSYDAGNHLTTLTSGSTTYTYGYDAAGNRTTAAKNGTRQRSTVWDTNYQLPQAAAEYGASGALTADYQYNPLEQIQSQTTPTGSAVYYHHDQLGSVTDLTDNTGNLQTSYAYTAYGQTTRTNTGTNPPANPFTYTGQYEEPTTAAAGLYLRARNYDPTTGRFTATDPLTIQTGTPVTAPYVYASDAPTRLVDPSGKCSVWEAASWPGCDPKNLTGGLLETISENLECQYENFVGPSQGRLAGEARFAKEESFIFGEMMRNVNSPVVKSIRAVNSTTLDVFGVPLGSPQSGWPFTTAGAAATWAAMVRPGGPWDHKGVLQQIAGGKLWSQVPGKELEVFYDIWSNIHYGYVGRSAKFSRLELKYGQQLPGTGHTDKGDILTSGLGMDLWEAFGSGLTIRAFHQSTERLIGRMSKTADVSQVRYAAW
ncbi:RHS repeat protein [Actinacidiphila bryophytorum]|uniref:RHS repeat protein n=4 Tax=Actinacidiphila bryophytorum TaxID=1436133 RepID=A0A9W4E926_9ACTN|nr:RHS repeat protein [Actinacidiphila bryophytorum]